MGMVDEPVDVVEDEGSAELEEVNGEFEVGCA